MNTITSTASTNTILVIDPGKYKSVACAYEPATASWQPATIITRRTELVRLLERFQPSTRQRDLG